MINRCADIAGIIGVILIRGEKMAVWGDIELAALPDGLLKEPADSAYPEMAFSPFFCGMLQK